MSNQANKQNSTSKQFFLVRLDFSEKLEPQIIEAETTDEALFRADPTFDVQGVEIQWNNFADEFRTIENNQLFKWLTDNEVGFPPRSGKDYYSPVYQVTVKDSKTKYMIYRIK